MKTYIVKTKSANNEMLLHSTMQSEFATTSLEDAQKAFHTEIECLGKTYENVREMKYELSQSEDTNAIFCELIEIDLDAEDPVETIDIMETSDLFYNPTK